MNFSLPEDSTTRCVGTDLIEWSPMANDIHSSHSRTGNYGLAVGVLVDELPHEQQRT